VLTVIVTITGEVYMHCLHSLSQQRGGLYAVLTVIVNIMGKYICSVYIHCHNNGEVYMQC
jgi:hypothetical protein